MTHSAENDAPPEDRPCYRCGKNPAEGFASIWSAATGERWYCHGDGDESPTCYEAAQRPRVIPPAECAQARQFGSCVACHIPPAKRDDWHEFTEDVDDASMCVCGVPALTHDAVFPPGAETDQFDAEQHTTRTLPPAKTKGDS